MIFKPLPKILRGLKAYPKHNNQVHANSTYVWTKTNHDHWVNDCFMESCALRGRDEKEYLFTMHIREIEKRHEDMYRDKLAMQED